MTFTELMLDKAKRSPKSILLPEPTDPAAGDKILKAAEIIAGLGAARPVLLGAPEEIRNAAKNNGVTLDSIKIINFEDEEFKAEVIRKYLEISEEYSAKSLNRKFGDPLNFAAALVRLGYADCLGAGLTRTTGEVILAAQMFIGLQERISVVSSIGIAEFPHFTGPEGNMLCFTDCAVNINPSSEELADIAIISARTVKALLGWDPRVAMLSFSTKGSGDHGDALKVAEAVRIAKDREAGLEIDGEFQLDAAIIPASAAKKVKQPSSVAGKANILVFPDLDAGNIGVKMAQIFGGAIAHGPLLCGFARPVTDFSRSAPVEEIVGNLVMLSVYAQNIKG
jgi:phosphate acetyltransferase